MALLTTDDVAAMLGIGTQRVRRLASQGRLKGERVGRDWVFKEVDVKKFAELPRPSGGAGHRNKKQQAAVA